MGGWTCGRVTIQIIMPLCGPILQDEIFRFSHKLKFQDRARFTPVMLCACTGSSVCSVGLGLGVTLTNSSLQNFSAMQQILNEFMLKAGFV